MNRNTKRKFESDEFIPDDGSMHNMNTNLNPNRQPQGQQPHAHTSGSGVGPVAFNNNLNHFDYNSNLAATFTDSTLPSTVSAMQPFKCLVFVLAKKGHRACP